MRLQSPRGERIDTGGGLEMREEENLKLPGSCRGRTSDRLEGGGGKGVVESGLTGVPGPGKD